MTVRANYDNRYLWRYVLIVVVGIGWALYCAYDLTFKYPRELEQANIYHKELKDLEEEQRQARWDEICEEKGWGNLRTSPRKPDKVEEVISLNYLQGAVALLIGTPPIFLILFSLGSWVEGDENGIRTSWKQEFQFADVVLLDKKKWEKKGIARVEYQDGSSKRFFVLDDFKYEREPVLKLLKSLEATLSDEQIAGGPRESVDAPASDGTRGKDSADPSTDAAAAKDA